MSIDGNLSVGETLPPILSTKALRWLQYKEENAQT